jgi:uncharacterized protein (DUF169 family)
MEKDFLAKLPAFLGLLGLSEEPMAVFYTDKEPEEGFSPPAQTLPTRDMEAKGQVDWPGLGKNFSCAMGNIWRARRKHTVAYFSNERFGCLGGAFWLGFLEKQLEGIVHYVTTGIPGQMQGECYLATPDSFRRAMDLTDPRPAPARYLVFKPLDLLEPEEEPELVTFFARPESLCGLHQLAAFATDDPLVVVSPWSAACGGLAAWPLHYLARGENKAVLGGWDPSARKFFKTDELSFTVPLGMFEKMLSCHEESFLKTKTWDVTLKKALRSQKAWGEKP